MITLEINDTAVNGARDDDLEKAQSLTSPQGAAALRSGWGA
ncbi:MAG: hypothetical protein R3D63_05315 [Paracoccaceae bacterium]